MLFESLTKIFIGNAMHFYDLNSGQVVYYTLFDFYSQALTYIGSIAI